MLFHLSPYPLLLSLTFKSIFLIYSSQTPSTCLHLLKPTSLTLLQQYRLKTTKETEKGARHAEEGGRGFAKEPKSTSEG